MNAWQLAPAFKSTRFGQQAYTEVIAHRIQSLPSLTATAEHQGPRFPTDLDPWPVFGDKYSPSALTDFHLFASPVRSMSRFAEVEQWLAKMEDAAGGRSAPGLRLFELEDFGGHEPLAPNNSATTSDATAELRIEFGRARLALADAKRLEADSILALEQPPCAPVDLLRDGQLFGRGELLVMNEQICVRVTELLTEASFR